MADKKPTKTKKMLYKATSSYKKIMTDKGMLSKEQHEGLLSGKSIELSNVPEKQLKYLEINNLIEGV